MEIAPLKFRIGTVYGFCPINTGLTFGDRAIVEIEDISVGIGIHCVERLQLKAGCSGVPLVKIRRAGLGKGLHHTGSVVKSRYFYGKKMRLVFLPRYRTMMALAQLIASWLGFTLHSELNLPRLSAPPIAVITIQVRIAWMIEGQSIHV